MVKTAAHSARPASKPRLLVAALHPVSYQVPFYRALEADDRLDSRVIFFSRRGTQPQFEKEWGTVVDFGADLLNGYNHTFLYNLSWNEDAPFFGRMNPGIVPRLLKRDYDAVLVTGYHTITSLLAIFTAKLAGRKVLLRAEADLGNPGHPFWRKVKNLLLGSVIGLADAVMYSCRRNRDYWLHYGAAADRCYPILSSVATPDVAKDPAARAAARQAVRDRLGIPADALVFVFVGRMNARKRPADVIRAFAQLAPEGREKAHLLMLGDGVQSDELRALADSLGLKDGLTMPGYVSRDDVPQYLVGSDIFVLPSEYDPTPKALNEAMVCGLTPLISDAIGTAGDLVIDGQSGMVVKLADVEGWRSAFEQLIGDAALRARLAAGAHAAVADWTPEANVDGVVDALHAVLAPR